jgi:hypothetical protein
MVMNFGCLDLLKMVVYFEKNPPFGGIDTVMNCNEHMI